MASFDQFLAEFFNQAPLGNWTGLGGTFFGVPPTIFGFTSEELQKMPDNVLRQLIDILNDAFNKADEVTKDVRKKAMLESGLMEFDTDTGTFVLLSDTSKYGLDRDQGQDITDLQSFLNGIDNS